MHLLTDVPPKIKTAFSIDFAEHLLSEYLLSANQPKLIDVYTADH